jgi:metal-responsive CopG/Arc/MetJ family transcriptional regulator
MKRFAVSLPDHQARAVEEVRRRRRVPRSRVIQEAVELYFREQQRARDVRAYAEGYRRRPEKAGHAEGYARAAAEVLGDEEWA